MKKTRMIPMEDNANIKSKKGLAVVDMKQLKEHYSRLIRFCTEALLSYEHEIPEREILITRQLIAGYPIQLVAEWHGTSTERVRQLYERAICHIKRSHTGQRKELEHLQNENVLLKEENLLLKNELAAKYVSGFSKISDELSVILQTEIKDVALSRRTRNVLTILGVEVFRQIPTLNVHDLWLTPNCGKKTINEIKRFLKDINLSLEMTDSEVLEVLSQQKLEIVREKVLWSHERANKEIKGSIEIPEVVIPLHESSSSERKQPEDAEHVDVVMPKNHGRRWSKADIEQIQEGYAIGCTIEQIAKSVQRTNGAVIAKFNELFGTNWITSDTYRDEKGFVRMKSSVHKKVIGE